MKIMAQSKRMTRGYALITVMVFLAVGLVILASTMDWANQTAGMNQRFNEYNSTLAAAESATEIVFSHMSFDFKNNFEPDVNRKSTNGTYSALIPLQAENPYWKDYEFSSPVDGESKTYVVRKNEPKWEQEVGQYSGLNKKSATYWIISNVRNKLTGVEAAVGREIKVGTIPVFQFAIFYTLDMEMNPGAAMDVHGRVHTNQKMYSSPGSPLTFHQDVTSWEMELKRHPDDWNGGGAGSSNNITFKGKSHSGVTPMNLPIGTNNSPDAVHAIIEIPPADEDPDSDLGKERYFNKADLVLLISNNTVTATSGRGVGIEPPITLSSNDWQAFVSTNVTFFNKREELNIQTTEIDVAKLRQWALTNSTSLGTNVNLIYVGDMRDTSVTNMIPIYAYTTNTTYITNTSTTTSSNFPTSGTYLGSVITTTETKSSTSPPDSPPASNIATNTITKTTTSHPSSGNYVLGTVATNCNSTVRTKNTSPPSVYCPGSLVLTQNNPKKYQYKDIKNYTYKQISGYTYNVPAYIYDKITSTNTYTTVSTNIASYQENVVAVAQSGVRLVNGERLPAGGLTVATPNPLYIKGDYNVTDGVSTAKLTTNTTHTLPASVVADAVTILSKNWDDAKSGLPLADRNAPDHTTINTAILAGIVPTESEEGYSGGVENFPRYLESWSGKQHWYNGSMVVMFPSKIATGAWDGTGNTHSIYNAPTRKWAFDKNFLDEAKLPPGTPSFLNVQKVKWVTMPVGKIDLDEYAGR